jgi:hypothetical protein
MALSPQYKSFLQSSARCDNRLAKDEPNPIRGALIRRLGLLGVDRGLLPWLIRNLAAAHRINPHMNHRQFNRRLRYLGWSDLDLDYHTWQLALACLEFEGCRPAIQ